ncbi:hypothetical protein S7711_10787 [Stachybotrys chartarum IBT 7711]|uniref:Uncharacterized protein n=1 Tax=Stachybotrys chartarum (strain CBS 109288 / IBT 7711) TaxID=1280523 RepID=A0A084AHW8_STACB|nr:hypothetical protein S7711_10787 [Stachybotrys chartarum IBT 7711]
MDNATLSIQYVPNTQKPNDQSQRPPSPPPEIYVSPLPKSDATDDPLPQAAYSLLPELVPQLRHKPEAHYSAPIALMREEAPEPAAYKHAKPWWVKYRVWLYLVAILFAGAAIGGGIGWALRGREGSPESQPPSLETPTTPPIKSSVPDPPPPASSTTSARSRFPTPVPNVYMSRQTGNRSHRTYNCNLAHHYVDACLNSVVLEYNEDEYLHSPCNFFLDLHDGLVYNLGCNVSGYGPVVRHQESGETLPGECVEANRFSWAYADGAFLSSYYMFSYGQEEG